MASRKFGVLLTSLALTASLSTSALAVTVPGAVYSDSQAQGVNKPASQVAEELQKVGIQDVKADHWAAGSLTVIIQAGLIQPDANGNLNPDSSISSQEGVALFAKVLGIASKTDDAATAAVKAEQAGLASGFSADRPMTRLEVARLLATALGIQPKPTVTAADFPFADIQAVNPEDWGLLAAMYEVGIFKGYEDRTFRPDGVLTKAQIAILVDRILGGLQ